jgi:hypothetical protein
MNTRPAAGGSPLCTLRDQWGGQDDAWPDFEPARQRRCLRCFGALTLWCFPGLVFLSHFYYTHITSSSHLTWLRCPLKDTRSSVPAALHPPKPVGGGQDNAWPDLKSARQRHWLRCESWFTNPPPATYDVTGGPPYGATSLIRKRPPL